MGEPNQPYIDSKKGLDLIQDGRSCHHADADSDHVLVMKMNRSKGNRTSKKEEMKQRYEETHIVL